METLPWPAIVLGIAAALAILVMYDVVYVWPLCRRTAAVAERCRLLEQTFADLPSLSPRWRCSRTVAARTSRRSASASGSSSLRPRSALTSRPSRCAEHGDDPDRLISCFGLTEGEAKLVTLLHGDRRRWPERKTA